MAIASADPPSPRREPLRFTLGGMLLTLFLVLSIGLAYLRWERVTFWDAMLLSFAIWLVIGLAQRLRRQFSRLHELSEMPRSDRWGRLLELIVPAWCVATLAIVACT